MLSTLITARIRKSVSGTVVIDARPGEDLLFTVTWSTEYLGGCEDTMVTITSPTGAILNKHSAGKYAYSYKLRTVTITVLADTSSYKVRQYFFLVCYCFIVFWLVSEIIKLTQKNRQS